ncbi:MAG: BrxA/BrxB family bacilliredoxin [Bacteroidetes bacterium]|nr:BrxA/BrxB family bacilliredoxin [Bacteroidota bacterium]MBX7047454.1 BrxA/BrxB family bacilliredoxin [Ignavibacteria bacterium]
MYDPIMVQPMRDEAIEIGFKELYTPEEVNSELSKEGTTFVFVNSVCGCAAGKARPGLAAAINWAKENNYMPDRLITVFAGMEKDAVSAARSYFGEYPPSSPQMAMLKDGKIVNMIERLDIENNDAHTVANKVAYVLKSAKETQEA